VKERKEPVSLGEIKGRLHVNHRDQKKKGRGEKRWLREEGGENLKLREKGSDSFCPPKKKEKDSSHL